MTCNHDCTNCKACKGEPLSQAKAGTQVIINCFAPAYPTSNRLTSMGLLPGTVLDVINTQAFGAMLVEINGCRIAIGHEIASNILVKNIA